MPGTTISAGLRPKDGDRAIIEQGPRKGTDHHLNTTSAFTSAPTVASAASSCLPDFPSLTIPTRPPPVPTPTAAGGTETIGQKKADTMSKNKDGSSLRWKPRIKRGSSEVPIGGFRGKGNNGWGNLPPQILRIVFTHALDQTRLDQPFRSRWQHDRMAMSVILALKKKEWMFGLREVSLGWRSAVDNHPFWTSLIYRLDPHFNPSSLNPTAPLASSRSNAKQPTPFQLARRACPRVCVSCRLFQPTLSRPLPAESAYSTRLNQLGEVATCEWHHDKYCHGCLVSEYPPEGVNPHGDIQLSTIVDNDVDDSGDYLPMYAQLCKVCRTTSINAAIVRQLKLCARGGTVRGLTVKWHLHDEYEDYIQWSNDTADNAALALVSKWALTSLAEEKYLELEDTARELQTMEFKSKMRLFSRNLVENVAQKQERWELMMKLEPHRFIDPEEDRITRGKAMTRWGLEFNLKGGRLILAMQEEEEVEGLNRKYSAIHTDAFLDHVILERIRCGIWVLPSLEIDLLSTLPPIPPLRVTDRSQPFTHPYYPLVSLRPLITSTSHPFHTHPDILPIIDPSKILYNPAKSSGLFCLVPGLQCDEPVLPPPELTEILDGRFKDGLRSILVEPMRRMMKNILGEVGDEQATEKICAGMGLKEVLEGLRTEEVWFKQDTIDRRQLGMEGRRGVKTESGSKGGRGSTKARSPIVELVQSDPAHVDVDEPIQADFGIKVDEEWTEEMEPHPVEHNSDRVSLGKRKSPPTESTAISDRQTRAKGDSTGSRDTSASTTPTDEVIMPITPEDVLVETLQHAAVKGQPTVKAPHGIEPVGGGGHQPVDVDYEDDDDDSSVTIDSEYSADIGRDENGHYEDTSDHQDHEDYPDQEEEELTPPPPGHTPPSQPDPQIYPHPSDLHTRLTSIPHIPLPASNDPADPVIKMLAQEEIMQLWYDVRRPLRVCRCKICERARERERRERGGGWMGMNLVDVLAGLKSVNA